MKELIYPVLIKKNSLLRIAKNFMFTLSKLCAFPVKMCIPSESHPIPGEVPPHSRWHTSSFPVRMCIASEDESQRDKHSHREWWCDWPRMHILTGNGDVTHREWRCDSPGMHIVYTGCCCQVPFSLTCYEWDFGVFLYLQKSLVNEA